jgi:hypothetical protein
VGCRLSRRRGAGDSRRTLRNLPSPIVRPLAGVLVLAALVAAGCGGAGGSKNDYVKSLNKAQASLQESLASLGDIGSGGTQAAATLEAGGKAMDAAADDFNGITPPGDAKHAHGQIVDGLHKLAGTFHDAAKAAKSNDLSKLAKVLQDFEQNPGAKEIQAAESELKANGYKVRGS